MSIAWCLTLAQLAAFFGLSAEIGAFIAGVSLAASPIAVYIAESLKPIRDFFLVMFFFSVGATFNLNYLSTVIFPAILLAGVLLMAKPVAFRFLLQQVGETKSVASEVGVRLGQISEFSLIIAYVGMDYHLISDVTANCIQAAGYFIVYGFLILGGYALSHPRSHVRPPTQRLKSRGINVLDGLKSPGINILKQEKHHMHDLTNSSDDLDPVETREWLDALTSVIKHEGRERAQFLLNQLSTRAEQAGVVTQAGISTPYMNTIDVHSEAKMPEDGGLQKLTNIMRWNAIVTVLKTGKKHPDVGGHLSSFASIAILYEVGLQFFFRAPDSSSGGDSIYYQGHSSPGICARAFLEGRLEAEHLDHFRQEAFNAKALSSYPHPWLMPEFWQFPTVSMGLGPLMGIYQAHFLKYLHNRGLSDTSERKVGCFAGTVKWESQSLWVLLILPVVKNWII